MKETSLILLFALLTIISCACSTGTYETLDFVEKFGFEGAQFSCIRSLSPTLDTNELKNIRKYADDKGLYTQVSLSCLNKVLTGCDFDSQKKFLKKK